MESKASGSKTVELSKQDLEFVLRKELGSHLEIQHFSSKALTNIGDNYGSTILAVDVIYKGSCNDPSKNLSLVAKLMPPSEFLRDAFCLEIIFNKEARTYVLVAPEHRLLQKEQGIPEDEVTDLFPRFYGARTNLQENLFEKADDCALILLENLKASGYEVGDRRKGLNLNHVKLTVISLARFHALTLALKIHKPDVFKETVLKACERYKLGDSFDSEKLASTAMKRVEEIPECRPYLKQVENSIVEGLRLFLSPPIEPFATLLHNDFWVNNMLFCYGSDDHSIPAGMKFVDFQIVRYDSPVRDLLFFLFTSSEHGLLDQHFDHLLSLYHQELIGFLTKLQCSVEEFSYENFQRELDTFAPREFAHILFLLSIVSADRLRVQNLSESNIHMFDTDGGDVYTQKAKSLILTFVNKGWL